MRGLLKYRRWLIVASQTVLIVATYYAAYQIDFDFDLTLPGNLAFLHTLPLVVVIKILLFRRLGLLGGWWRYAGMSEALDVIRAAGVSSGILFVVFGLLWRLPGLHLTVMVVDLCLTIMVTGGARFAVRAYTEQASASYFEPRNALIVGAGRVGSAIARELREHPELNYSPVGFVDDDSRKLGIKIHGVTVLGTTHDLLRVIAAYNVDCAVIAVRSAPGNLVQRVIEQCQQRKVELKIAPASAERMNGLAFSLMRNVSPEDLLGRTPVRLDPDPIRAKIENKIVLITGAGGSIGSELARQVAHFKPSQLLLFDRSENDLFRLGTEFSRNFPMLNYVLCIGDISDVRTLRDVFALYRPSSVFHAAAYKHVPMMEVNPWQAVTNNIFGTYNVALVAREHQADDFILISTDKAVNPTNIMGVSKRVAELIILALQQQHTRFTAVRFGNVLGSNGSVLPLFQQQIATRGPLTVTHPDVTRYFMTIPEAVQLVLQASAMGRGGEIFVLDMGRSVRILDLANNVIRISGLVPERDVQIVFTGLRPGEKLFEELSLAAEGLKTTAHEKIRVLDGGRTDMAEVVRWLDDLSRLVDSRNINGLITALVGIVPQYRPSAEVLAMSAVDRYDYSRKYLRDRAALTAVPPPSIAA
jgi:FlaA1/EpsC-like NDP-sugar epimerase